MSLTFDASYHDCRTSGYFSALVLDYVEGSADLRPFYRYTPDVEGLRQAVRERAGVPCDRSLLVAELLRQYQGLEMGEAVRDNIEALSAAHTFTVCTAHQPVILGGPMFVAYKIIQVISLARELQHHCPGQCFVPVYVMGSEDADLAELGQLRANEVHWKWETHQRGAVGRMQVDESLIRIREELLSLLQDRGGHQELAEGVRAAFSPGKTVAQATRGLMHFLFGRYGLVILDPDAVSLKQIAIPLFRQELDEGFSHREVSRTLAQMPDTYRIQARGREVNLFYLTDEGRIRVEREGDGFRLASGALRESRQSWLKRLEEHPERFSPNVILRPLMQELWLPNVAFVGGGAELAYWMELKSAFDTQGIFFPVLVLRASFLQVPHAAYKRWSSLGFAERDWFSTPEVLIDRKLQESPEALADLSREKAELERWFQQVRDAASRSDVTLQGHVEALRARWTHQLESLEKKMYRAVRRTHADTERRIRQLQHTLSPGVGLQEREQSLLGAYAEWGTGFSDMLLDAISPLKPGVTILTERPPE